jgi:3-oxoacyl-[acyl-carrier protein] reductase
MAATVPTALVTGGEGDLARAIEGELSSRGWHVVAPGRAELDVADEASTRDYFARLDRLDLLVANAGVLDDRPITSLPAEGWDRVLAVNLRGAFFSLRSALPLLETTRGSAVLIGSRVGRRGGAGQAAYAAAKAGLIALAQTAAAEHGAAGVRCNVVLPGFLETKMVRDVTPARRDAILAEHRLGRFNTVAETARFVAFLAGLEHASGQVFQLDSRSDRWT